MGKEFDPYPFTLIVWVRVRTMFKVSVKARLRLWSGSN